MHRERGNMLCLFKSLRLQPGIPDLIHPGRATALGAQATPLPGTSTGQLGGWGREELFAASQGDVQVTATTDTETQLVDPAPN